MFRDRIELKDLEKMDAEYRDLLGRVVTIQADCEIGGPHLYVKDILPSAPSKVDQLMVARTAAEEMDHYRKIARVGGDVGVFCYLRVSHRPRGSLPIGRISWLYVQTPGAHLAADHERRNRSHRVRPKQDSRACG